MFRIVADHVHLSAPADNLAFLTHEFDACTNFHTYFILYVILPFVAS